MFDVISKKRLIMISGKGGTGKTTTAAATSIKFAEDGFKTAVISLDPAHSLGDSFDLKLGPDFKRIEGVHGKLFAMEFDPKLLFEKERSDLRKAMETDQNESPFGEMLPKEMFDLLLDTNYMPVEFAEGIGFLRLLDYLIESDFEKIIFDTAPTGHTLKLLELPDYLDSFVGKMIRFQLRVSSIFSSVKRLFGFGSDVDVAKETLKALDELKERINNAKKILTNKDQSEFVVVTLPLDMSIYESARLVGELDAYEIPNHFLVVNMVRIYNGECGFCKNLSRMHLKNLDRIFELFSDKEIRVIPFFSKEIRGVSSLREIIKYLADFTLNEAKKAFEMKLTID